MKLLSTCQDFESTSERPKVPLARLSAEPSVVNSTEAEPSVVPTERDLWLMKKIVTTSKYRRHFENGEELIET